MVPRCQFAPTAATWTYFILRPFSCKRPLVWSNALQQRYLKRFLLYALTIRYKSPFHFVRAVFAVINTIVFTHLAIPTVKRGIFCLVFYFPCTLKRLFCWNNCVGYWKNNWREKKNKGNYTEDNGCSSYVGWSVNDSGMIVVLVITLNIGNII